MPTNSIGTLGRITSVTTIEKKVDEQISVIHPAHIEHNRRMVTCQSALSLYDRRNENSQRSDQDIHRLSLDRLKPGWGNLSIMNGVEGRYEAKKVLRVDCGTHTYPNDVWIRRNLAKNVQAGHGRKERDFTHLGPSTGVSHLADAAQPLHVCGIWTHRAGKIVVQC